MQAPGPPGSAEQQAWGRAQPSAPHRPPGLPMTLGSPGELRRAPKPKLGWEASMSYSSQGTDPCGAGNGGRPSPDPPSVSPPSCVAVSSGPGSAL